MAFIRPATNYIPDINFGRPLSDAQVFLLTSTATVPQNAADINLAELLTVTYVNDAGNTAEAPQPLRTTKGGCLFTGCKQVIKQFSVNASVYIYAVYDKNGNLEYQGKTTGSDFVDVNDLAAADSTVLVGGAEAGSIQFNITNLKLLADAPKIDGRQYAVYAFYEGWAANVTPTGGGVFVWDAARAKSQHNGGTIIAPEALAAWDGTQQNVATLLNWSGSGSGCFVRACRSRWFIDADWFGYVGRGTDETAVLQRIAALASADNIYQQNRVAVGIQMEVNVRRGDFVISDTVNFSSFYMMIDFNGSWVKAVNGAVFSQDWGFRFSSAYDLVVKNLYISDMPKAIDIDNDNIDTGFVLFDNCRIITCKHALRVDARSSSINFKNFRIIESAYILDLVAGDMVNFDTAWIYPSELDNAGEAFFHIRTGSQSPRLTLRNIFYGPFPQTAANCTAIRVDANAFIHVDSCLFGGELGQVPLMGWYAASSASPSRPIGISIKNTQYWSVGRPWIELHAFPASITLDSCYGGTDSTDSQGLIKFIPDVRTLAEQKAISNDMVIDITGPMARYSADGTSRNSLNGTYGPILSRLAEGALFEYVRTPPSVFRFRKLMSATPTATDGVKLDIPTEDRYSGCWFKVYASIRTTSTLDVVSEYLISYDFNGNASLIKPITEGVASNAPRIVKSGNDFYATFNASPGSEQDMRVMAYKISDIVNTRVGF